MHEVEHAEGVVGPAARVQEAGQDEGVQGQGGAAESARSPKPTPSEDQGRVARGQDRDQDEQPRQRKASEEGLGGRRSWRADRTGAPAEPDQPVEADVAPVVARRRQGRGVDGPWLMAASRTLPRHATEAEEERRS